MSGNLATLPEPEPLRAVTVSRDVQEFDLLIEDMEAELGEGWGDLDFPEALAFLKQDDARDLEFIVVAVDHNDENHLSQVGGVIRQAKLAGLRVILVAEGLGPAALHELLRAGADDFTPYPLPENALADAVTRLRSQGGADSADMMRRAGADVVDAGSANGASMPATTGGGRGGNGAVFAIQGASGGAGATTVAVNLAWEIANDGSKSKPAPSVCLIDLSLQFGTVATYLDLDRKAMIYEVLTDVESMDEQAFRQALTPYKDKMQVFTAPADILPLDLLGPEDVTGLLSLARSCFDIVVVDMPNTLTAWTDVVMSNADVFYLVCELEVRSAQNAMRLQKLLKAEGVVAPGLGYILNKAPGKMDMGGRGRIDKMADSLDIKFAAVLPDGGKPVSESNDQAIPLRDGQPRNVLTKEVAKLASEIVEARSQIEAGIAAKPTKKKAIFGLSFG